MQLVRRYPSSRRLLRQLSTTSTSESSFSVFALCETKSTTEDNNKPALPAAPSFRRSKRPQAPVKRSRVQFDEFENEVYFNHDDLEPDEIDAYWYSSEEIDAMRQETEQLAAQVLASSEESKGKIQRAYSSLVWGSSDRDNVQLIMKTRKYIVHDMVGLEKHLLFPRERQLRVANLRQQVAYWSNTLDCRESDRWDRMRVASERESRPFRLFAVYVAMNNAVATCV